MAVGMHRRAAARGVVLAVLLAVPLATPVVASASGDTLAAQMYRLRVCESSDNYRTNTGNGFYGAYQFSAATWHGMGYRGRPDRSTRRTQDAAARRLHSARGWRPWTTCARREHLR